MAAVCRVEYRLTREAIRYCLIAEQALTGVEPIGVVTGGADPATGVALACQAIR